MIPKNVLKEVLARPDKCVHIDKDSGCMCNGRITLEHAWIYAGKQIQEAWAIVKVCWYHHLGNGLEKDYNRYKALLQADIKDLQKRYPKKNWEQELKKLKSKYDSN